MKTIKALKTLAVLVALFLSLPGTSQEKKSHELVLHPYEYTAPLQISKEDFPKGEIINMAGQWGGLIATINEAPAGSDFTPVLAGLKDDLCQVPHWGYLEKGKIRIIDKNKNEVVVKAGGVFYMPPGHTLIVEEDMRFIDFSPEHEMVDLKKHVLKKVAEMQNNQ